MKRRMFVSGITFGLLAVPLAASSLLAVPRAAEAQQAGRVYTIGILSLGFQDSGPVWWEVFLGAMRELNYVQGRNLLVKFAFASDQPERLAGLAGDLVRAGIE